MYFENDDIIDVTDFKSSTYEDESNSNHSNTYGEAPRKAPEKEKKVKKEKKTGSFLKRMGMMLASGMAFGLAAVLTFGGCLKASGMDQAILAYANEKSLDQTATQQDGENSTDKSINQGTSDIAMTEVTNTSEDEQSVSQVVKNVMPSIVSITNKSVEEVRTMFGTENYESESAGSGIIIGQNETELLIATNNHVVAGSEELTVCFDDDEDKIVKAKVKGTDSENDLAIVAVDLDDLNDDILNSIKIITIGSSDDLEVGDQVIAIGNALGYGQSVTSGIVSAKDREVETEGGSALLIQTDAAINPGNSGGALVNAKGELVGINSSKYASTTVEGMGFAIPIATAQPILADLMERETRDAVDEEDQGYLGISCQNVTDDISKMYNVPKGVYVVNTNRGGAANEAGIQSGDIITGFEGTTISEYDDLTQMLKYYKAGETVTITIKRAEDDGGYKQMDVQVTLGSNPNVTNNSSNQSPNNGNTPGGYGSGNGSNSGSSSQDIFSQMFGNE